MNDGFRNCSVTINDNRRMVAPSPSLSAPELHDCVKEMSPHLDTQAKHPIGQEQPQTSASQYPSRKTSVRLEHIFNVWRQARQRPKRSTPPSSNRPGTTMLVGKMNFSAVAGDRHWRGSSADSDQDFDELVNVDVTTVRCSVSKGRKCESSRGRVDASL